MEFGQLSIKSLGIGQPHNRVCVRCAAVLVGAGGSLRLCDRDRRCEPAVPGQAAVTPAMGVSRRSSGRTGKLVRDAGRAGVGRAGTSGCGEVVRRGGLGGLGAIEGSGEEVSTDRVWSQA